MLLFAYGSLLNPDSAERALQRPLAASGLVCAELSGYRLCWTSIQRIAVAGIGELDASFLNLRADAPARTPGVLLSIDASEFARLRTREKGYSVHRVECQTEAGKRLSAVTFVDERLVPATLPPAPKAYLVKIEQGLAQLSPAFAAAYRAALPAPPGWVEGEYAFVDPGQKAHT